MFRICLLITTLPLILAGCHSNHVRTTNLGGRGCSDGCCDTGDGSCSPIHVCYEECDCEMPCCVPCYTCDELERRRLHAWALRCADRAWDSHEDSTDFEYTDDFEDGFQAAFIDTALGRPAVTPAIPPKKYWQAAYRTPGGHRKSLQWFNGYELGLGYVEAQGCRPYSTVATRPYAGYLPPGPARHYAQAHLVAHQEYADPEFIPEPGPGFPGGNPYYEPTPAAHPPAVSAPESKYYQHSLPQLPPAVDQENGLPTELAPSPETPAIDPHRPRDPNTPVDPNLSGFGHTSGNVTPASGHAFRTRYSAFPLKSTSTTTGSLVDPLKIGHTAVGY